MKKTLLAIALLTAFSAHATGYGQGASALTQQQSSQSNSSSDSGNRFIAIPPVQAIAPSQSVNAICQVATPQSNAVSVAFLISVSKTSGVQYNDVCYAYLRGQYDVADKLMCLKSADYAKVNAVVCK